MARLLEGRYARYDKAVVVCDNLNTHTADVFYEAFAPERARATVRRHRDVAIGNRRLVERCERVATRRRLTDEARRRPLQTEIGLPDNEDVAEE